MDNLIGLFHADVIPAIGALIVAMFGFGRSKQKFDDLTAWQVRADQELKRVAHLDDQISGMAKIVDDLVRKIDKFNDLNIQVARIDERTNGMVSQVAGISTKLDLVFDRITARN